MDSNAQPVKQQSLLSAIKRVSGMGVTMRIRLYAFLLAVVFIMLLGIVFIFVVTGLLSADQTAAERFIEKEFSRLHRDLTLHIGDATVELVSLSQDLSRSIELQLLSRDILVSELRYNPDVLEELIANELFRLQIAMERSRSSGIFMVLDATINPNLEYSEYSKAGLYLRDYEPRAVGAPEITWCFFRGFSSIAHQNGLLMQAGWELEFNVRDVDFFNVPMELGQDASLPLSRMYYWSNVSIIPELDESILKCSIPLIDSSGEPFGVCGFEISNWNFRLRFAPDDDDYPDTLVLFGPITGDNKLLRENILFSGKQRSPADHTALSLISSNGLGRYISERGIEYYGVHREVRMYPADSPFAHERFALSLLIPKETIDAAVQSTNRMLAAISLGFLIIGIGISFFISHRYLKPIKSALDAVRSGSHDMLEQTNIREIDELLNRLTEMRSKDSPIPDNLFEDFIVRVKTLTPTEMTIFRHYYNGVGINEIPGIMFISMNTLKSHNKHIYTKLDISSRDELMLYFELLKKSGMEGEIISE